MELNVHKEVAAMQRQGAKQLRTRYAEVFGETTAANNKVWLIRRIAWRLQALAEGDLSERARRRAELLANDADLRLSPPRAKRAEAPPRRLRRPSICDGTAGCRRPVRSWRGPTGANPRILGCQPRLTPWMVRVPEHRQRRRGAAC